MNIKNLIFFVGCFILIGNSSCVSDSNASETVPPSTLDEVKAPPKEDTTKLKKKKETKYIRPIEIAQKEEEKKPKEEAKTEENKTEETQTKERKTKKAAKKERKSASKKPIISFERKNWSFGKLTEGDKVDHKFFFTNTGNAPLVIKDATATCGCTYPSRPYVAIKPGEKSYIGVSFDSKGKLGQQKPTVTVMTNAGTHKLYLQGEVEKNE